MTCVIETVVSHLVLVAAFGICMVSPKCSISTLKSLGGTESKSVSDVLLTYQYFSETDRQRILKDIKRMFYFGYNSYKKYAFPLDELNPIHCTGRGPDKDNPGNININDVLGNYSLTLIDSLDTLAILGDNEEFKRAVQLVIDHVTFDTDNVVQVFEATIRVMGGLLAAHLLITEPRGKFGNLKPPGYRNQLLHMAVDLASRLLPAFNNTKTGMPWPRVNLRSGVSSAMVTDTCPAGAGTLSLEFGILSALTGNPLYREVARKAVNALWQARSGSTGLLGNTIDMQTGNWTGKMSGLGAGVDSYYEYLLKSYIVFGDRNDLKKFDEIYKAIKHHMRKGRDLCNNGSGEVPIYVNVNMDTGSIDNTWIDSLQAAFSAVQVLRGDIDEAVCSHLIYYGIWQRYGAMPERFNWHTKQADVKFYPLRPELVESTYLLYQATKHPFYLHVGAEIFQSIESHAKAECGYATLHDVEDKSLEDRMESFFLSETCKYLYLLFDITNPVNVQASEYIFSTEGHIFRVNEKFQNSLKTSKYDKDKNDISASVNTNITNGHCTHYDSQRSELYPLQEHYFHQMEQLVGLL